MKESSSRPGFAVFLVLLLTVILPGKGHALSLENARSEKLSLHAVLDFKVRYTTGLKALRKNGAVYVDLRSMSRALRLYNTIEGNRLSVTWSDKGMKTICLLTAGSNFASVRDENATDVKRVFQMRTAPVLKDRSLWIRAEDAVRLYSLWMNRQISYNGKKGRIDAFLWSPRPDSVHSTVGIVNTEDRTTGPGFVPRYTGPTTLTGLNVSELANGIIIKFKATGSKTPASYIKPDSLGNATLTFQHARGTPAELHRKFKGGFVKEIRAMPIGKGAMQIDIAFNTEFFNVKSSDFTWDPRTNTYKVMVMSDVDVKSVYRAEKEKRIAQDLSRDARKWLFDTIVLDAGHGGKDPGAIGPSGTREKDVVLNIVLYLGQIIRKEWPDVKVVYTRGNDRFIPLKQRGKIANRNDGKLFVSIHCNAARNRSARGAEVYILGPHKNKDALRVAMLENEAIKQEEDYEKRYEGFSEEHMIMSSLAQNAFTLQSKEAARYVLKGMMKKTRMNDRGVRQAGFMVLWTPSMPSVLVEAGYLSNREEEKMLRRLSFQKKIAVGIFDGLKLYRASYEKQRLASDMETKAKG